MSDLSLPEPVGYQPKVFDIQHDTDPAQDHGIARRIPHLGHAMLFLAIAVISVGLCLLTAVVFVMLRHPNLPTTSPQMIHAAALSQLAGYALTFAISFPVFPLLWHHSFLDGIHWTFRAARLRWWKLILLGIGLSIIAQLSDHFVKVPKDVDILKLLDSPAAAWITAISGALIAPVVEEIAFRGFLLPAIATAYDWLCLERTPAARDRWQTTTGHTAGALMLAAVVTSAGFAALHGAQLHWSLGTLLVLFVVSLAFSAVRIRYQSVAASSLVHVAYNSLLFAEMFATTGGFRHLDHLAK